MVFADKYWRIIRINEDGSIRVIYSGEKSEVDTAGKEMVLANGYDANTQYTQIGASAYNSSYDRSEYVGYTYSEGYQRPSDNPSDETDSTMKEVLDNWYSENIGNNSNYDNKVVNNIGFCNDREIASGSWSSTSAVYYMAYIRRNNGEPSFECNVSNDLYKTKVGLITADEIIYAGGSNSTNYNYYLYTGSAYWTISPAYYSDGFSHILYIGIDGYLSGNNNITSTYSIRPVINISSNATITGTGTIQDPYVVQTD